MKAVNDGSVSYAALEKKAELYDKLVRGELPDEEDQEKYCVDFFRKGVEEDESPQQPIRYDVTRAELREDEEEEGDGDASVLFNFLKPAGPGRTDGVVDNAEHKRNIRYVIIHHLLLDCVIC